MSSKAMIGAAIDAYEDAIRVTSDAQRRLACRLPFVPAGALLRVTANLTRDIGAAQLSGVRWIFDA